VLLKVEGPGPNFRYLRFANDVKEAKYWRRWIADGHIGGLPEGIARIVMLMHWENARSLH